MPGSIPRDRFDVFAPLMSLPTCLGADIEPFRAGPYLKVPPHVQVPRLDGVNKVGFVWQGSPTHKDERRRSIPLQTMATLFNVPDVDAYSFQYPVSGEDVEFFRQHDVHNLEAALAGYSRTAAYAQRIDLFVTVDTSMAHLAGALGRPVWILLAYDADWRWGLAGERSDWYPTARLFRQAASEGWDSVLQRVARELAAWCRARMAVQASAAG